MAHQVIDLARRCRDVTAVHRTPGGEQLGGFAGFAGEQAPLATHVDHDTSSIGDHTADVASEHCPEGMVGMHDDALGGVALALGERPWLSAAEQGVGRVDEAVPVQ